jgi:hypothetical protein
MAGGGGAGAAGLLPAATEGERGEGSRRERERRDFWGERETSLSNKRERKRSQIQQLTSGQDGVKSVTSELAKAK